MAERLHREGLVHHGLELRFDGRGHRIAFSELTGGRAITVYGQQEVVKDLIAARLQAGGDAALRGRRRRRCTTSRRERRAIRFRHEGAEHELRCDVIAGCDGFHGICRPTIPDGVLRVYEREYPFAWLGILAEVAPSTEELIYCHHERGFALHSMRSPKLTRLYLQCAPDDDIEAWPDERIWEELQTRLATDGRLARSSRGRSSRRASRRCAASSPSRCGTAASSWPATRPTSCRPPAPRASTSPSPTCACSRGARRAGTRDGDDARARRLLRHLPAARLARAALLVVDDLDAAPLRRRRPVRGAAAALPAALRRLARARRPRRWPRTTSGSSVSDGAGLFDEVLARGRVRAADDRPGVAAGDARRRGGAGARAGGGRAHRGRARRGDRGGVPRRALRRRRAGRRRRPRWATRPAPLVRALRAEVGDPAAADVHRGATSQDVLDSATMLVARRALDAAARRPRRRGRGGGAAGGRAPRDRRWPGARCCSRPCRSPSG